MEKKIVVPEGMLNVACRAYPCARFDYVDAENYGVFTRSVLEAALGWLSENPIWPTSEQAKKLIESFGLQEDERGVRISPRQAATIIANWQRHMFLAPEPEVRPFVKDLFPRFCGVTLTKREADAILEQIRMTTEPGWEPR